MLEAGAIALKLSCGGSAAGAASVAAAATDVLPVVISGTLDHGSDAATLQAMEYIDKANGPDWSDGEGAEDAGDSDLVKEAKHMLTQARDGLIEMGVEAAADSGAVAIVAAATDELPVIVSSIDYGTELAADYVDNISNIEPDLTEGLLKEIKKNVDIAREGLSNQGFLNSAATGHLHAYKAVAPAASQFFEVESRDDKAASREERTQVKEQEELVRTAASPAAGQRVAAAQGCQGESTNSGTSEEDSSCDGQEEALDSSWHISIPSLDKVLPTIVLQALECASEFSCNKGRGCSGLMGKRQKPMRSEAEAARSEAKATDGVESESSEAAADFSAACSRQSSGSSDVVWV